MVSKFARRVCRPSNPNRPVAFSTTNFKTSLHNILYVSRRMKERQIFLHKEGWTTKLMAHAFRKWAGQVVFFAHLLPRYMPQPLTSICLLGDHLRSSNEKGDDGGSKIKAPFLSLLISFLSVLLRLGHVCRCLWIFCNRHVWVAIAEPEEPPQCNNYYSCTNFKLFLLLSWNKNILPSVRVANNKRTKACP